MAGYTTYQGLQNVSLQNPNTKVLSDTDYKAKAVAQYDPSYNMKIQGLQNTLRNNLSNLETSKTTIDANYDKAAASQNLNNRAAINSLNNDALNRGLGRSSIVTSGIGSANLANNRALASLMTDKTSSLNNVALQQANASADEQNNENTMQANRLDEIQTLADKLKNTDLDRYDNELASNRNFYMQQLNYNNQVNQMNDSNFWKNQDQQNWQKSFDNNNYWKGIEQSNWQKTFAQNALNSDRNYNLEKLNSDRNYELNKSKSGSGNQTDIDNAAVANFQALQTPQDQYKLLQNPDFIKQVSQSTYKSLMTQYQKNLTANKLSQSLVNASYPTYDYGSTSSNTYSGGR